MSGLVWKFAGSLPLVPGLKLEDDPDLPGHYLMAPVMDMPLGNMGMCATKVIRKAK